MDELILVKPGLEHRKELEAYKVDTLAIEPVILRDGGWDECATLEEWLGRLKAREQEATCPGSHVPASTYLCIRQSDHRMVGFIDIRHRLNDYLLNYAGHIGYSIRPIERGKGYAGQQLELGLNKCRELGLKRVLLTCDESNMRSRRTIENAGGVYEDSRKEPGEAQAVHRYWIDIV